MSGVLAAKLREAVQIYGRALVSSLEPSWVEVHAPLEVMSYSSSSPMANLAAQRPASIRSVASNTSTASGVSLTRRARTRVRSKTLTGGSSNRPDDSSSKISNPDLPYLDKVFSPEPPPSLPSSRSPHPRQGVEATDDSDTRVAKLDDHGVKENSIIETMDSSPRLVRL